MVIRRFLVVILSIYYFFKLSFLKPLNISLNPSFIYTSACNIKLFL